MNHPLNPAVTSTVSSPISEAYSWLEHTDLPAGVDLIDVSQAVPGYPPAAELTDHVAGRLSDPAMSRYGPVLGMPEVRAAFAENTSRAYATSIDASQVAITAGCNQAFSLVSTALCSPGDEFIVPVPYYFNHDMWLRIQGIVPRYLECDDAMIPRLERVEELVNERTRALVLITPNNPTGTVYSPGTIQAFARACARLGITLVLDETYRDFRPSTEPAHRVFDGEWWTHVVHLYSFSKTYSITGYRTGAIVADPHLLFEIDKIADCIAICPPRAGQEAALYGMTHLGGWVEANRRAMNGRVDRFRQEMAAAPTGFDIVAAGAYFAYVRHPYAAKSGTEVARRLLSEHAVICLAGEMFGPDQQPFLRLAFANLDDEMIPELVRRLAASS
jgi:aspartate/methionine/tyrosine aminotransferase